MKARYIDYYSDKTTLLRMFSLSLAFALVVLLSFGARFFINKEWNTPSFWGDFGFSASLAVYCIFLSIPEAKDNYKKKAGGRYQSSVLAFRQARERAKEREAAFDQWLDRYYAQQRDDYFRQLLSAAGIRKEEALRLDLSEIGLLDKPYKKEWREGGETYFPTMTKEQRKLLRDILSGKVSVRKIPNDAFRTMGGKIAANEYVEQSRKEGRQAASYAALIAGRLLLMFIVSFLLAIFGIRLAESSSAEQAINQTIQTIGRIWTMATSYVYGFSIGRTMVADEADRIDFKTRVNEAFASDGGFEPADEEEELRRAFEEQEAKSITPEVVEETPSSNAVALL